LFEEIFNLEEDNWFDFVSSLAEISVSNEVIVGLGPANTVKGIKALPRILKAHNGFFAYAAINAENACPEMEKIQATSEVMLEMGRESRDRNFQFAAGFGNLNGVPFFPSAYHKKGDKSWLMLGMQMPGIVVNAMKQSNGSFKKARELLTLSATKALLPLQEICLEILKENPEIDWNGIDTSIAPDHRATSLIDGFESMGITEKFGTSGTLSLTGLVTDTIKNLPGIKIGGYSGLMLPPLEDTGLAKRMKDYDVHKLLMMSSVCAIGIDTVPIPLDTPIGKLNGIYADVAMLSYRINNKPLSVRFLPVEGKAGDEIKFEDNPHLTDGIIMGIL